MSQVPNLTTENFDQEVAEGVTFIDLWAPWCGPCLRVAPVIEELYNEWQGKVKVRKVNTDEERELTMRFEIRSIPTLLLFKDGKLIDRMVGAGEKEFYLDFVGKNVQL